MIKLTEGQCGMCEHFGGGEDRDQIVQIRINGEAPAEMVEPCGHPSNESLKLKVAPNSGCAGFQPAKSA